MESISFWKTYITNMSLQLIEIKFWKKIDEIVCTITSANFENLFHEFIFFFSLFLSLSLWSVL